jgi:dTDP-glucose pyrophosphorylase
LTPTNCAKDALAVLDTVAARIALVVDANDRLLGSITDGDIRRSLLANRGLDAPVTEIMNPSPITVPQQCDRREALRMMNQLGILHLPIIDAGGRLIGLYVLSELLENERRDNWVVLMAGGEGRRLYPITRNVPKPMIPIGGRPILETILNAFLDCGFYKFFISINYLGDQISSYFGDGSKWGAEITYLREDEKRGTAGCLSLLPEEPNKPIFVMNGDLLTKVNFGSLLDFHAKGGFAATMCIREHAVEIPFGVVEVKGDRILTIKEKPTHKYFINSGIYVINPKCIEAVPKTGVFDMTMLLSKSIMDGEKIGSFPIYEYWADIGRMPDLERATLEFDTHFD